MDDHFEEYGVGMGERFWLLAFPDLTIYGHTINQWTQKHYPEDWDGIREMLLRGREWGCWHSRVVPEGEIGSNPVAEMRRIPRDDFFLAAERGWPYEQRLTTARPAIQIFEIENGERKPIYSSLEGRTDFGNRSAGQQDRPGGAAEEGGGGQPPEADDDPAAV